MSTDHVARRARHAVIRAEVAAEEADAVRLEGRRPHRIPVDGSTTPVEQLTARAAASGAGDRTYLIS